jgi:hypothetical protein
MSKVDELGKLEALHQAGSRKGPEFAAEEAKLLDEILASVDLGSPEAPEVGSADQTNGAGAAPSEETWETALTWGFVPAEEPAVAVPPVYSAPTPAVPTSEEPAVAVLPPVYSAPTPAVPTSEEPAVAVLPPVYNSATPAVPTFIGATPPSTEEKAPRSRLRVSSSIGAIFAAVFLLVALGAGFVALKQTASVSQWRLQAQSQVPLIRTLSIRDSVLAKDLVSARAGTTPLNSEISKLNGQVKSLQAQLSGATIAREKMVDQSGLVAQLTKEAGTASRELSACVGDVSSLGSEIDSDLSHPSYRDPHIQANTNIADQVCAAARQDNQQLLSTLNRAG